MAMNDTPIYIEETPPIGWIVFNRPEKMNAFNSEMWDALPGCIRALEDNPAIRVIVIRGAGERAFCAGADISEFEENAGDANAPRDLAHTRESAFTALADCAKPTVAMIHGFCMGGGCAIALNIDIRIAADDARFAITPARLGLGYPFPGIERAVQELGPAATRYIFMTANTIDARQAAEFGIVQDVHPAEELRGAAEKLAQRIAANAPKTIRAVRESVRQSLEVPANRDLAKVDELIAECFASRDYKEGLRAFVEKRTPEFNDE